MFARPEKSWLKSCARPAVAIAAIRRLNNTQTVTVAAGDILRRPLNRLSERPLLAEALAKSQTGELTAHVGGSRGSYFVEIEIEGERLRLPAETVIIDRRLDEFPDKNILS